MIIFITISGFAKTGENLEKEFSEILNGNLSQFLKNTSNNDIKYSDLYEYLYEYFNNLYLKENNEKYRLILKAVKNNDFENKEVKNFDNNNKNINTGNDVNRYTQTIDFGFNKIGTELFSEEKKLLSEFIHPNSYFNQRRAIPLYINSNLFEKRTSADIIYQKILENIFYNRDFEKAKYYIKKYIEKTGNLDEYIEHCDFLDFYCDFELNKKNDFLEKINKYFLKYNNGEFKQYALYLNGIFNLKTSKFKNAAENFKQIIILKRTNNIDFIDETYFLTAASYLMMKDFHQANYYLSYARNEEYNEAKEYARLCELFDQDYQLAFQEAGFIQFEDYDLEIYRNILRGICIREMGCI